VKGKPKTDNNILYEYLQSNNNSGMLKHN